MSWARSRYADYRIVLSSIKRYLIKVHVEVEIKRHLILILVLNWGDFAKAAIEQGAGWASETVWAPWRQNSLPYRT
jgi:hypothetical protein